VSPAAVEQPQTAWTRAVAELMRRGSMLVDGLVDCPCCARGRLYAREEADHRLNLKCFSGCSTNTIARALRLEPADLVEELEREVLAERKRTNGHSELGLEFLGFSGDRLRATRDRPEPVSPLPGLFDPAPSLHVLLGRPKSGKTTFVLALAQAWAEAGQPWASARPLPGGRVLVISREQPLARVDATLRRLALHSGRRDSVTWENRMSLVARDSELPAEAKRLLTLDEAGLAMLRGGLDRARADGDPYTLAIFDSLSRLKPAGLEERDNDGMSAWLDELAEIALEFKLYLVLIHHVGHSSDPNRSDARGAGRGASSISAVAQAIWLFERDATDPHVRRVQVDGNAILPAELHFEVADGTAEPGSINYFRRSDPLAQYVAADVMQPDEVLSLSALALRLGERDGKEGAKASGGELRLAKQLVTLWEKSRLIDVTGGGGPGKGLKIRLRGSGE
jgi:hypothetical protein